MTVDMEQVKSFINLLVEAGMIADINNVEKRFQPYDWFRDNMPKRYDIYEGACKGVIAFKDADYVIKFDYYGDESYCKLEANNYADAVAAGLARYFAETHFVCEIDGVTFVIQEKCDCDESMVYDSLGHYVRSTYERECSEYNEDTIWDEVECLCEEGRAYEMCEDAALAHFICNHYINDLHQGNFGFIGGRLVITDFSGF
jgi:hypothetical protein